MKFEEAFDKVAEKYDKIKSQHPGFVGATNEAGFQAAIMIWNMIALAQSEKGLDDFVFRYNNGFISIPLKDKKSDKDNKDSDNSENDNDNNNTENKKGRGRRPKSETATDESVNVKEEQKENPPTVTE